MQRFPPLLLPHVYTGCKKTFQFWLKLKKAYFFTLAIKRPLFFFFHMDHQQKFLLFCFHVSIQLKLLIVHAAGLINTHKSLQELSILRLFPHLDVLGKCYSSLHENACEVTLALNFRGYLQIRQKTQQVEKSWNEESTEIWCSCGEGIWYIQFSRSDLVEIPISITGFSFSELHLLGHRCIHLLISHWLIHSLLRWCVSGYSCLFFGARRSFPGGRAYSREKHGFGRAATPRSLVMEINIPTQAPHSSGEGMESPRSS